MDDTTSDIPREVADIIVDLNVIANIPTNCKLNTLDGTYVDADSLLGNVLQRWTKGESRDVTVDYINSKIDQAIETCKRYPSWTSHIAERVSNISNALVNLEQTYKRQKKGASVVERINLLKLRIEKQRFLRTCQLNPISSSPLNIVNNNSSNSSISSTIHTGLTPLLNSPLLAQSPSQFVNGPTISPSSFSQNTPNSTNDKL